jgi:hypothetical protein
VETNFKIESCKYGAAYILCSNTSRLLDATNKITLFPFIKEEVESISLFYINKVPVAFLFFTTLFYLI